MLTRRAQRQRTPVDQEDSRCGTQFYLRQLSPPGQWEQSSLSRLFAVNTSHMSPHLNLRKLQRLEPMVFAILGLACNKPHLVLRIRDAADRLPLDCPPAGLVSQEPRLHLGKVLLSKMYNTTSSTSRSTSMSRALPIQEPGLRAPSNFDQNSKATTESSIWATERPWIRNLSR